MLPIDAKEPIYGLLFFSLIQNGMCRIFVNSHLFYDIAIIKILQEFR